MLNSARFAVAFAVILTLSREVISAPVIDQSNAGPSTVASIGVPSIPAQTFTVGLSGQLTGFDLRLLRINFGNDTGEFTVQLRDTVNGIPTARLSPPLAELDESDNVLPNQSGGDFGYTWLTHFDITTEDVFVHKGDVLAIDIFGGSGTDANDGFIMLGTGNLNGTVDTYSGGTGYYSFPAVPQWKPQSFDYIFQSYVDPSVPEPMSVAMLGGFFICLT